MEREEIAPILIGAIVFAAVVAGLLVAGGPITARAEKRDNARLDDLRTLKAYVWCMSNHTSALPVELRNDERCNVDLPLLDPTTGNAYTYNVIAENAFELCAKFEFPDNIPHVSHGLGGWVEERGCFVELTVN